MPCDQTAILFLQDVLVDRQHYQVKLKLQGDKFIAQSINDASNRLLSPVIFNLESDIINIPHTLAFGKDYRVILKHLGNLEFKLQSIIPY